MNWRNIPVEIWGLGNIPIKVFLEAVNTIGLGQAYPIPCKYDFFSRKLFLIVYSVQIQ